jgi:hypothetical protein
MGTSYLLRSVLARCAVCLFASVAVGCGGEDSSSTASSDTTTPAANSSKASGTAGSAAKERGEVSTDECVVETLGTFAVRPGGYSSKCVECICKANPRTVALCDDQANLCWSLISCSGSKCKDLEGIDAANCAISMCGQFIEGSGLAMSVGALLRGDTCSADCPPPSQ